MSDFFTKSNGGGGGSGGGGTYTADRALQSGASGAPEASGVTATELSYLAGVTSALQAQLAALVPAGSVIAFGGATAPAGYLICDGSPVSRTTYATLFANIGTAHGTGDGTTTFHLPDYRGRFLRGVNGASGRDLGLASRTNMNTGGNTGDNVGSIQAADTLSHLHDNGTLNITASGSHTHTYNGQYYNNSGSLAGLNMNNANRIMPGYNAAAGSTGTVSGTASAIDGATHTHPNANFAGNTGSTGGTETRPLNAYVTYIIKF